MTFMQQYGPWALVAGASEGVGKAFADTLARKGLNVVLLARRQQVLDEVASAIRLRHGVQTRSFAIDLARPDAANQVMAAVRDIEIGFFVYCAGAEPNYRHFLDQPLEKAESLVHRNCIVSMQLCYHLCQPMVARGRGGVVLIGSGAGFVGAANVVAYGPSKAFNMVFAEALWCELKPRGVDVLGLILGETDTPALRRLRHERGLAAGPDEPVRGAETAQAVVDDAITHLSHGPTRLANRKMRWGLRVFYPFSRNVVVWVMGKASEKAMGKDPT
jgi:uncharacterized protein